MTRSTFRSIRELPAVWVLTAVAVIRLWLLPLGNSFWVDESLTVWMTHKGLSAIPTHQSALFAYIEWGTSALLGTSEWALRMPSILAALACIFVFYRLGEEILNADAGVLFAILFLSNPQINVLIPDARPYALATLAHAGSLLFLFRWLRTRKMKEGVLWITCAALATHLQHLFLFALPVEAALVLWRFRKEIPARARQLAGITAVGVLLFVPVLVDIRALAGQAVELGSTGVPSYADFLREMLPLYLALAVALVVALEWVSGVRPGWRLSAFPAEAFWFGLALYLFPHVLFFGVTRAGLTQLYASRFLLPGLPGLVIFAGVLLCGLDPPRIRHFVMTGLLAMSVVWVGGLAAIPDYHREGWRQSVRSLPDSGGLLLYSGLVEGRDLTWLRQPDNWTYAAAPALIYRPSLKPSDVGLLPYEFDLSGQRYVEGLLSGSLKGRDPLGLLVRSFPEGPGPLWIDWIGGRLRATGYQEISRSEHGFVAVRVFRRVGSTASPVAIER